MDAWGIEWLILVLWIAFIGISYWTRKKFLSVASSLIGLLFGLTMINELVWFGIIIIIISIGLLYYALFD